MANSYTCPVCGGRLEGAGGGGYRCPCCGKALPRKAAEAAAEALRHVISDGKREQVPAMRRRLYDAMRADPADAGEVQKAAYALKAVLPGDYLPAFAIVASGRSVEATRDFLYGSGGVDAATYGAAALDYSLRVATPRLLAAVSAYADTALSPAEYAAGAERYDREARRVDPGVFDAGARRDAFLACSEEDAAAAARLCDFLEDSGFSCFLPSRNLPRSREDDEARQGDVEKAIDSCDTFVFLSSRSSRTAGCEARSRELLYVMRKEQRTHGGVKYEYIPRNELKHRVEYLLEPYSSSAYDDQVRSFFRAPDRALTREEVAERLAERLGRDRPLARAAAGGAEGTPAPDGELRDCVRGAEAGDAEEQNALAGRYFRGDGVERDLSEALRLWRLSAEQGCPAAQCSLGNCLHDGIGAEKDLSEAALWLKRSASAGYAPAQLNMGFCCFTGEGVERSFSEAVGWWLMAAENGSAAAEFRLGYCYMSGLGVERDEKRGVELYVKAAEGGDADAQNNLGNCYFYGKGVEKDAAQAVYWYTLSAENGCRRAQEKLARCFEKGYGTEKDREAYVRWSRAARGKG